MSNLYENPHYIVERATVVLGEDNRYGPPGYKVVNKETGVTEHTTMVLPQAIFQADAMSGALTPMKEEEDMAGFSEDVVIPDGKPN